MKRLITGILVASTLFGIAACDRKTPASPPTPTSKQPDSMSPAPVRPGDPSTPAVPGPGTQPPMPDAGKK